MAPVAKYADIYKAKFLSQWDKIASFRKPLIAAVNGYAVSSLKVLCEYLECVN